LDILEERCDHNNGLQKLVIQPCQVQKVEYELREFTEETEWDNVVVVGLDYEGIDTDKLEDKFDEHDLWKYYWLNSCSWWLTKYNKKNPYSKMGIVSILIHQGV